jgi:hypothetical protein
VTVVNRVKGSTHDPDSALIGQSHKGLVATLV